MNTNTIAVAVAQRLLSDTGTGGLFTPDTGLLVDARETVAGFHRFRRNYSESARVTVEAGRPVVVLSVSGGDLDETGHPMQMARGDGGNVEVLLEIYAKAPEFAGDDGDAPIWAIEERIFGDATLNSDMVPTYGLHRHMLVLSGVGGWEGNLMQWKRSVTNYDEKTIMLAMTFKVAMERTAPNPA